MDAKAAQAALQTVDSAAASACLTRAQHAQIEQLTAMLQFHLAPSLDTDEDEGDGTPTMKLQVNNDG